VSAVAAGVAPLNEWMTTAEVAAELRTSPDTVRRWIREKKLHAEGTPGRRLIHRDDVEAFRRKWGNDG
jgi:excisionase family DNA binding protein